MGIPKGLRGQFQGPVGGDSYNQWDATNAMQLGMVTWVLPKIPWNENRNFVERPMVAAEP